jgi:site-specific DNA-adenine methylase
MINWVGNKYKYLNIIKPKLKDVKTIFDPFMGSCNVWFNLEGLDIVASDNIKLLPVLYDNFYFFNKSKKSIKRILEKWRYIDLKDKYYEFRDVWNQKYSLLDYKLNKDFLIETIMILKMCNNSMIRFNKSEEFNQGFRGFGNKKSFFDEGSVNKLKKEIDYVKKGLEANKFSFYNLSHEDFYERYEGDTKKNDLWFIDHPYMLYKDMYNFSFDEQDQILVLEFLKEVENGRFIYFEFLEREGIQNKVLKKYIKKNGWKVEVINNNSSSGAGRKKASKVKEVMVYNF